jgi:signal transduction histidine kinase
MRRTRTRPVEASVKPPGHTASTLYHLFLTGYTVLTVGWLALGAVIAAANHWPGVRAALAATGGPWARGILAATPNSEPFGQAVLDYALSVLNLVVAAALWWAARRDWTARLLTIAVVGSAGAFNLQAHASVHAVHTAFGINIGYWHVLLLHGVSGVAYVLALLLFPTGRWESSGETSWLARAVAGVAVAGALSLLALSTAEYPHTISFVIFFGVLTPLVGVIAQWHRAQHGSTPESRRQSWLLFTALAVALGIAVVLALATLVLWRMHSPAVTLVDPTAHVPGRSVNDPTAMVFWIVRLIFAAIPCALLIATTRSRLWDAERVFSRTLAYALVVVLLGSGYVLLVAEVSTLLRRTWGDALTVTLCTGSAALVFQPVRVRIERLLDHLIYGSRPAPYAVLAQVANLSGIGDHANLTGLAQAVAGGLGTSYCELTLCTTGLGDRTHRWPVDGTAPPETTSLPVLHKGKQVGVLAIERASVASLSSDRRQLLDNLVGVLGPVLHNSRLGIELEDQLRTSLRRADEIAVSRRRATAETDSERRSLERDLHDGAQHHLVALRMSIGLVEHEITHGRVEAARERLDHLVGSVDTARKLLADTAAGVFPITLADHGLLAALAAELRDAAPSVVVESDETVRSRRFPLEVETAVYFACLEAVNNARKHAPAATVTVRIHNTYRGLEFVVADDGPGFTGGEHPTGRGLRNIADRADSAGGSLTVRSSPGSGTTVEGFIPL